MTTSSEPVTDDQIRRAYKDLSGEKVSGSEKVRTVSMHRVAKDGISIVSRLMDELDGAATAEEKAGMCYDADVPIFTYSHECRLMTECHPFALPDGRTADMLPCAKGSACVGMNPDLRGHKESGGIVLRGALTPEELSVFETTGKNPKESRLCVLCARNLVCEAYFETQDPSYEKILRGVCFNFYANLRGCKDGYKPEHTVPLGSSSAWNGLIAPVACNSLSKMVIVRKQGVWSVDQRELAHEYREDDAPEAERRRETVRVFR